MNSFKIIILVLLVGLGFGACENFLTPDKDNEYTKDRFYNDPAWAWGLMVKGYVSLLSSFRLDEVATDDAVTNDMIINDKANDYLRMATGEWTSLFDPETVWTSSYGAIMNLNYFLSIVNQVTWSWQDTLRNRLFKTRFKGEAYGLRGYYYWKLLERNGGFSASGDKLGVPLITTVVTSTDDWKVQRASFDDTFNQAKADLDSGIRYLPYKPYDIPNASAPGDVAWNRVNGTGLTTNLLDGRHVRAIKARLFLTAASPYFNNGSYDLVKADSAAKITGLLIQRNGGLAALSTDPIYWDADNDISKTDGSGGNAEILWRADYSSNYSLESANFPPSLYGSGRTNPTQNFVDCFPMKNGYPISDLANSGYDAQNPYANRDPRLAYIVTYNGSTYKSKTINTQADNPAPDMNDGLNKQTGYSTRTGYYMKKLLRADCNVTPGSTTSQKHQYARIRWTEMFLIYAECANEVYGPDGDAGFGMTPRQIIGALRKRGTNGSNGISQPDNFLISITDKVAMRDLIRNERRIELAFEGFRFWDLRRWNVPLSKLTESAKGVYITGSPAVYSYNTAGVNPVENRVYLPNMYWGPVPYLETKKFADFQQNKGW